MPDFSRIKDSVDIALLQWLRIVIVGAGGTYSLILNLVRCGIQNITVIDFDTVEASNVCRQGFDNDDIGSHKIDALESAAKRINPDVNFTGIKADFTQLKEIELKAIFEESGLNIFGTDSFKAQAFGNLISLRYDTPAIWSGWYTGSKTGELFFQIPGVTPACFRCCTSSRYLANELTEVKASSNGNTIFHSQFLDSLIGFMALAILHRNHFTNQTKEVDLASLVADKDSAWLLSQNDFIGSFDFNFFQIKVHPDGGNRLFDKAYGTSGMNAFNFQTYWQRIEPELKSNGYSYDCPDCQGRLLKLVDSKGKEGHND